MKKKTVIPYSAAFVYEIVKVLYIASFSAHYTPDLLLFKYTVIAALCVPVLPWLMLALNEKAFYWALYAAALFKLSSVCAEFLYIFHGGFDILAEILQSTQVYGNFAKEVFFFLAADTVLLIYSYMKGSMYYANNTDC
mgnify:CR=1 FL=1